MVNFSALGSVPLKVNEVRAPLKVPEKLIDLPSNVM